MIWLMVAVYIWVGYRLTVWAMGRDEMEAAMLPAYVIFAVLWPVALPVFMWTQLSDRRYR